MAAALAASQWLLMRSQAREPATWMLVNIVGIALGLMLDSFPLFATQLAGALAIGTSSGIALMRCLRNFPRPVAGTDGRAG